jgi:small subunit ribosomal protein S19
MSRSIYKGNFFKVNLKRNKKWIKVYNKSLVILPEYVNYFISVYNGKTFMKLKINNKMVGFKLGEFIYTKKKHIYKKNLKNGPKNNTNKFKIK